MRREFAGKKILTSSGILMTSKSETGFPSKEHNAISRLFRSKGGKKI
jgi:hypothetical protein